MQSSPPDTQDQDAGIDDNAMKRLDAAETSLHETIHYLTATVQESGRHIHIVLVRCVVPHLWYLVNDFTRVLVGGLATGGRTNSIHIPTDN